MGRLIVAILLTTLACAPTADRASAPTSFGAEPTSKATTESVSSCQVTNDRMTPPPAYVEFLVGGASDPVRARADAAIGNFVGNEALWLLLPRNGVLVGLTGKFLPWRTHPGQLNWSARRLDGSTLATRPVGRRDAGDVGFAADTVEFPEPGCWQVIYTVDGQFPLAVTVEVK